MSADEALFQRAAVQSISKGFVVVQETCGRILAVNEPIRRQLKIDQEFFVGHDWREFVTDAQIRREQRVHDQVAHTGDAAYMLVDRVYHGQSYSLVMRVTRGVGAGNTPLIFRESYPMPTNAASAKSLDALSTHEYIVEQLRFLRGLAQRDEDGMLAYMIDVARLAAEKEVRRGKLTEVE